MLRLRDTTPASERLKPPATEAELRWFRKKRLRSLGRSVLLASGAGTLFFVGSLLRDPARAHPGLYHVEMGLVALIAVGVIANAIRSANLVKDIQARRIAMHEDQRKRIFLRALDDDVPAA
jgi:hypothetical protein